MKIAFTPGEPAGIGIDLAIMNAQKKTLFPLITFSDPDLLLKRAKLLNLPLKVTENESKTITGEICVYPVKLRHHVTAGKLNVKNAAFVLETIDLAIKHCLEYKTDALLTGAVHKGIINEAGINFSGHTEYLANKANVEKTVMMLVTKNLKVALVTTHLPLREVADNITKDSLKKTITILNNELKTKFNIKNPKILVCGLNPHAGEDGHLGKEEIKIINPVIKELNKKNNFHLIGAMPADTAFTKNSLKNTDCILAMYHDQGLPTLKAFGFNKAANITLGLPFIRSSVDHGTALNLAGTGNIDTSSLDTALFYTKMMLNNAKI